MEAELLSKCAGFKVKKTEKPSQNVSKRTSDSEKTESEEDEEFDSKDVDRMFKGIKKPTLTVFGRRQRSLSRLEGPV